MRPSRGPHARKPLRLLALGGASLVDADGVAVVEQRRRLALLVLIAAGRGKRVSRDKLVSYLSPESSSESARHALHQLLYYIRQQAGEDILLGTDTLSLNSDVITCDAAGFEDLLDRGDLDAAVALYRGPFLDGFHIADSREFDEWCALERTRLAARHADALFRLAARADAGADRAEAIRLWTAVASADPLDGKAALGLIRAHRSAGDVAAAVRHAAKHESALRIEMGAQPDAELVEYVAQLRAAARAAPTAGIDDTAKAAANTPAVAVPVGESAQATRRRLALPVAAAATVLIAVAAAAWSASSDRFGSRPPPPPVHDSLRLRVVTASVQSDAAHATLARDVRNTALAELAKDPWIFVITPEAWMQQAPLIGLGDAVLALPDTIRKYARKTRTHAIVDFTLSATDRGFLITAEAKSASTDSSLGVIAEAAANAVDLPNAMTTLSRRLRERLVEARTTLAPTHWSLNAIDQPAQAIELFVEARSEANRGNFIEASRRARAAVEVDSTFAQAWRILHTSLYNAGMSVDEQLHAISAAYRFRDRVRAPYWRLDIVSAYFRSIGDYERALVFYDTIARLAPVRNVNAGMAYGTLRRYELATRGYRRYADASPHDHLTPAHPNLVSSLLDEGKSGEARVIVASMMQADSLNARTFLARSYIFSVLREWDSLGVLGRLQLRAASAASDSLRGLEWLGNAATARGQLAAFDSIEKIRTSLLARNGSSGDVLAAQLNRARLRATVARDSVGAQAIADSALAIARWESLRPMDRPYVAMLLYLASIRNVARGAELAAEWSRETPTEYKLRDSLNVLIGRGELAVVSGKAREAVRLFRLADVRGCEPCFYPRYARAFDAMGESDSAHVWFTRYAERSTHSNAIGDAVELAHAYRRLGEIAEARGESETAAAWYSRFVDLWTPSDLPVLKAQARELRERADKLEKRSR